MFPPRKAFRATSRPVQAQDREEFHSLLNNCQYSLGFTWLLSPEPDAPSVESAVVPSMEKLLFCEEFYSSSDKVQYLQEKASIKEDEVKRVAEITAGQVNNPLWFLVRKYRLTASNFGKVIASSKKKTNFLRLFLKD